MLLSNLIVNVITILLGEIEVPLHFLMTLFADQNIAQISRTKTQCLQNSGYQPPVHEEFITRLTIFTGLVF